MKILFRADGNGEIGAGHIMRCLSIAGKAKKLGIDCVFVTADDSYYNKILDLGVRCIVLGTDFRNLENELPKLLKLLDFENPDRIIIDSYFVTKEYLRILKERTMVVYLDDVAAFAYPVDILINYNIYALGIDYLKIYKQAETRLPKTLLGPRFAPLRAEFQNISINESHNCVKNIFVSVGGSDPECIVMKMINYLKERTKLTEGRKYHFVIGDFEPDREKIFNMSTKYDWIVPGYKVEKMAQLMLSCDIAISAAGSTLYELCACGIPTVTYILEDNQIPGAHEFQKRNLMKTVGDYRDTENWMQKLFITMEELCDSKELRENLSGRMKKVIDGRGAEHIIKSI